MLSRIATETYLEDWEELLERQNNIVRDLERARDMIPTLTSPYDVLKKKEFIDSLQKASERVSREFPSAIDGLKSEMRNNVKRDFLNSKRELYQLYSDTLSAITARYRQLLEDSPGGVQAADDTPEDRWSFIELARKKGMLSRVIASNLAPLEEDCKQDLH